MREAGWSAVDRSDGAGGRVQSGHGGGGGGQPVDQELPGSLLVLILQARLDVTAEDVLDILSWTLHGTPILPWSNLGHILGLFNCLIGQLPPPPLLAGGEGGGRLDTKAEGSDGGGGGLGRHVEQLGLSPLNPRDRNIKCVNWLD